MIDNLRAAVGHLRGIANLAGKSLESLSRARSETGPKMTTGRGKPGCRSATRSYAGNFDMDSDHTKSSQ